jgi:hypothetical protein
MLDVRPSAGVSHQGVLSDSSSDVSLFDSCTSDCPNCARLIEQVNILRAESGFWKSCHKKALEREVVLRQKIEELEAKVRLRERQLFGRKSEKAAKGKGGLGGGKGILPRNARGVSSKAPRGMGGYDTRIYPRKKNSGVFLRVSRYAHVVVFLCGNTARPRIRSLLKWMYVPIAVLFAVGVTNVPALVRMCHGSSLLLVRPS